MGIIISLGLLLSFFLLAIPSLLSNKQRKACSLLVLVLGAWNIFWYGLSHWAQFWGTVAVHSGLLMLLSGFILLLRPQLLASVMAEGGMLYKVLRWGLVVFLAAYFLLYSITIIRLNLGYATIS